MMAIRENTPSTRKRKAPKVWRTIFGEACALETYAKSGFGYTDIQKIAQSNNVNITYDSLRVKLDRYKKSEYVKKIARGRFQIPTTGYDFFDLLSKE